MSTDQILLAVAIIITAVIVAGSVAKKLNLGSIVALLVVGMALGPHSPRPLLTGHVDELQTVGEIGVILLLFLVGLDIKPKRLSSMRRLRLQFSAAQLCLRPSSQASYSLPRRAGDRPWLPPSVSR